jgi:nicotinic acid mononucleotide adenylyltransferase
LNDKLFKYNWENKKPTALMLGRYQPWHYGHKKIFEKSLIKVGQVLIYVKNVYKLGDNPFTFSQIKKKINEDLIDFKFRFKILKAPNITNIFYGRKVGYKIQKINLSKTIQKISATKIRQNLRKTGKLNDRIKNY